MEKQTGTNRCQWRTDNVHWKYYWSGRRAVVLRGPRLTGIIKQFIEDTVWEELDFMIVDLPREQEIFN